MYFINEKLMKSKIWCLIVSFILFYLIVLPSNNLAQATPEDEAIGKWAIEFGNELYELGKIMTKSSEIKSRYKEYNARIEIKDGDKLIQSISKNLGLMFERKMEAIDAIMSQSEDVFENLDYNETDTLKNFQYYSSKYSFYDDDRGVGGKVVESVLDQEEMYLNMTLNQDTHFYNLSVDTDHSSVHVPSNVWDKNREVLKSIKWSEELDQIFIKNYQKDPALSWQYFCADTGILRRFPGMQWDRGEEKPDVYDCRKQSWYIETATCSKDVVILLDNSGSMRGFRYHVAKFTIRQILDTFSNNDFFTIFNYSKTTDDIIKCFKGALVQATPENKDAFNDAISNLEPEGYANLSIAYEKAFELLKKYYIERRCNETKTCNQAIMLVTDGVAGNTTEVFEEYNWDIGDNSTNKMRVRVFTYLLGKEVTKVKEIQWMACLNRGYYSHVKTLDEVHEEVLRYVDVIATPLVLQDEKHPPTWTHAFADRTYKQNKEDGDNNPRLMIAVGVPVFDRSWKKENGTKRARLLGVAGTDVPVEDIDKLTLPYKLGVNGYSFVVSNNGYVLLHPDLRPIYNQKDQPELKVNYNSIDFVEVEQLNDGNENDPRHFDDIIMQIRNNMVNHEHGSIKEVNLKFHYDKMRRVSEELQDYFYAPLPNTPFSLGLVLPSTYGKTWIKVGEEVQKNIHMNVNMSEYFVGENWKIHPGWVYCKYHYLEGHEYATPEDELRHFLVKFSEPNWKWSEQYEADAKALDNDAYYCNKELVELLIFDAKVTNSSYGVWKFGNEREKNLVNLYNSTIRFVGTMSGLTRWQFIFGEFEVAEDREFGDYHKTAIDEPWYRAAILQHGIESESSLFSVPHASDDPEEGELKVTSSHAIFAKDGGREAPGCVVGYQFSHEKMLKRFITITSKDDCNGCVKTCDTDEHDCFVIDSNGYIVLSQNANHTGKFFGEIEGAVMDAMVEKGIYQSIDVMDFQAMCEKLSEDTSDGNILTNPIKLLGFGINWLVTEILWHLARIKFWAQGIPFYEDEDEMLDDLNERAPKKKEPPTLDDEEPSTIQKPEPETKYYPCDKKSTLYILEQKLFISGNEFQSAIQTNYSRPFHAKRIPKTNLLLVVVKVMYATESRRRTTEPQIVEYDVEFPCYKLNYSFLERRRIEECFTEHELEPEYTYCGNSNGITFNKTILFLSAIIFFFNTKRISYYF